MLALVLADRNPHNGIITSILRDGQGTDGEQVDVVLCLGDLDSWALTELRTFPEVPLLGVYGNHCSGDYLPDLGGKCLHRRGTHLDGVSFAGLSGCPKYKAVGDYQYSPDQIGYYLKSFPQVDVFLTHCPPRGVNDDPTRESHHGWEPLATHIKEKQPKYLLHGHTNPPYPYGSNNPIVTHLDTGTQVRWVIGHELVHLDV
jgi:uncharacterized protein